jgi:hypothetical protein
MSVNAPWFAYHQVKNTQRCSSTSSTMLQSEKKHKDFLYNAEVSEKHPIESDRTALREASLLL